MYLQCHTAAADRWHCGSQRASAERGVAGSSWCVATHTTYCWSRQDADICVQLAVLRAYQISSGTVGIFPFCLCEGRHSVHPLEQSQCTHCSPHYMLSLQANRYTSSKQCEQAFFAKSFMHYVWTVLVVLLCSFKQGLAALGVLDAMKAHPDVFQHLMCSRSESLTAETVEAMFAPQLSTPGSNRRTQENLVYAWWLDMLEDIKGTLLVTMHIMSQKDEDVFHWQR